MKKFIILYFITTIFTLWAWGNETPLPPKKKTLSESQIENLELPENFTQGAKTQSPNAEIKALEDNEENVGTNWPDLEENNIVLQSWALGPLSSKIYRKNKEDHSVWGVRADLLNYQKYSGSKNSQINQLGLSLHFGHQLNSAFLFNSKIRFANDGPESHAGGDVQQGSAQVEMAYIDHNLDSDNDYFHIRIGNQLLPIGLANIKSELITELGVRPPELETELIPYAWNENGIMLVGKTTEFIYHFGVFNSLDGSKLDTNNSTRNFLKDAVQGGQNAKSKDLMGVARLDFVFGESLFGTSFLYGDTAQDSNYEKLNLSLGEVHSKIRYKNIELRAMWAIAKMTEAYNLIGPTFFDQASGYYLSLSYDLLNPENQNSYQLPIYIRYSEYDLHDIVSFIGIKDPTLKRTRTTLGINYHFAENIAYKLNYQWRKNAVEKEDDIFEISAQFSF
ncbi:MAG: hypothetical protein H6625_00955 [Bdellovibrionaceae bacterium]|nr:hypothetical protein [Pseudobdellovibrionaceae bacterium]